VFYYLTQSRKRVYADHAVQVRVAIPVSALSPVLFKISFPNFQVGFSSHYYCVAIGNPTNSLRHCSFHNIHRIASSVPGVSLYGLVFVVYRMSMTDKHTPHTQGEMEMWFPTIQSVIGKLYVLSHFYDMYVVTYLPLFQSCLPPCRFRSNSRPLLVDEQEQPSSTYVFPLTVPGLHGMSTSALSAPEEHPSELYTDSFGRADGAQ
jgi:hypothetical protein